MDTKKPAITGIIREYAIQQPEKTALIFDDQRISYGELFRRISRAANYLAKHGVGLGTHVVTMAKPCLEYIVCEYAILGLGAVHIPAENRVPSQRLAEIAEAVDAQLVVSPERPASDVQWMSFEDVKTDGEPILEWEPVAVSDDCSEIIFTTGTTGKSKGVMLSSHCLEVYLAAINPSFGLRGDSVLLVTTPLNHVGGLHRIHQCMAVGCTAIVMDGIKNLKGFFQAIHTYGVTHTYLPPASVKMLLTLAKKELAKLNGKLEFIYTASAPFPMADIEKLMELLPDTRLHQGYGSSETGSICNCQYNAPGKTINSLGKPYPCVEVELYDADGNPVTGANQEGYIRSRSGMNMLGYYKEPELTREVLRDGFIYSKDLMYFDKDGELHFAGRGDDVINIRGFKVAPVEVEDAAMKHPAVHDCVCVPYDDSRLGRALKLLVCLNTGYEQGAEGLIEFLAGTLEAYKLPQIVETIDKVERTANGKLNRKLMISLYSNVGAK